MKPTRRIDTVALVLGFLAFLVNGDNYAAAPLLVRIASDLSVDLGTAAWTVTSYMLFFGLLTIFFGPLGDRYGRAAILKVAAFGSAAFSMLSAVVPDLPSLVAVRAVNGAFSAGIMPLAVAFIGETSSAAGRHERIGKVMGMMFLGGALATVLGGSISYFGSWKAVYFVYGAAELVIAVLMTAIMRTAPGTETPASMPRTVKVFRAYRDLLSNPKLLRIIGLLFFIGFSTLGLFSYLGKFITDRTGFNLLLTGVVLSFYGIGTMAGGRTAAGIKKKTGKAFFPAVGIAGGTAMASLLLIGPEPIIAVPALFVYGFCFVCLQSSVITSAQDLMPASRGTVMSAASFAMVVSGALGTLINGKILSGAGFVPLILVCSVAFTLAAVLASTALRDHAAGVPAGTKDSSAVR